MTNPSPGSGAWFDYTEAHELRVGGEVVLGEFPEEGAKVLGDKNDSYTLGVAGGDLLMRQRERWWKEKH